MEFFDPILAPIMWAVAWIMVGFHWVFTNVFGLESGSGAAWALSIIGLVIIMRILLIPLFFKQIRASRGMQLLAPEMKAIQAKYKGKSDPASREAMSRETMELYKKHKTNPFSSCMPILLQSPIFFALFRVLNSLGTVAREERAAIGGLTKELAAEAESSTIFGAPLSDWFLMPGASTATKTVTVMLIVAMSATTFLTQKQLTQKNMPPSALEGPMAQQQKIMLYALPLIFAFSGVNFPIGVLIYWTTTNLWSMGQQFFAIRNMPAPGSEAERLMKERQERKALRKGIPLTPAAESTVVIEEKPKPGQRQQPKRKNRAKGAGPKPAGGPSTSSGTQPNADPDGTSDA